MAAPMVKTISGRFQFRIGLSSIVSKITTCSSLGNDNIMQSRTMQKMINKRNRKKVTSSFVPPFATPVIKDKSGDGKPFKTGRKFSDGMWRRAEQVSAILYENICQIIGSGELDIYIEVTKVQALPDMTHVNVHWEASGVKEQDNETQRLLEEKAGLLRHILLTSAVLGNVPKVVFVKDLSASRQRQVEELLRTADLGPDCIRNELGFVVSESKTETEPTDNTENDCESEMKQSTDDIEDTTVTEGTNFRQDLYGLQHDVLMQKLLDAKSASHKRPAANATEFSFSPNREKSIKQMSEFFKMNKRKVPKSGKIKDVDAREFLEDERDIQYYAEDKDDDESDLYDDEVEFDGDGTSELYNSSINEYTDMDRDVDQKDRGFVTEDLDKTSPR